MNITYSFDGLSFKTYGVSVSKSKGWFGQPARKKPEIYNYPEESGFVADLETVAYEARKITLECYIKSSSASEIINNFNAFTGAILGKTDTKVLTISIPTVYSISYYVYIDEPIELDVKISGGKNVGTFKLVFVEPELPTAP